MMKKFVSGITTGALIGATLGMMVMPKIDWRTRHKIKRTGRAIKNAAEGMYDGMKNIIS